MPSVYVLVPGAWHAGWCWRPLAERPRAAGHRAVALTLPDLRDGDDPRGLRLVDAVDHVVGEPERLDLPDVTLVGHSWAGHPIAGAAHRARGRISKLVYWNAVVPERDRSLLDELPPELEPILRQRAEASEDNTIPLPFDVWQGLIHDAEEPVQRMHALKVGP